MDSIKNKYHGQTCNIVGGGPSILELTAESFQPGPVVVMNDACRIIEPLNVVPLYSMQKDGNYGHCAINPNIRRPNRGTLIVETHTSKNLFPEYKNRICFDAELWFKSFKAPSACCALKIAEWMGCIESALYGFDSFRGDYSHSMRSGKVNKQYPRLKKMVLDTINSVNMKVTFA